MKRGFLIGLIMLVGFIANAQDKKLYYPSADADADIKTAVATAKKENKFVLIQAGGNWCGWCIEFARFAKADKPIDSVINNSFVWYHLNYSEENTNEKVFASLGYPQRFGFPVFIILDGDGNRVHTQASEYFEDGKKSYNQHAVQKFLEMWSPKALDPKMYGN